MSQYEFTINRQRIITVEGLHYEMVWELVGVDTDYRNYEYDFDWYRTVARSYGYRLKWSPLKGPMAGVTDERGDRLVAVTVNVQQAIDCGFLKLVAPVIT